MISEHKIITAILAMLAILGLGVVINALWGDKSPSLGGKLAA